MKTKAFRAALPYTLPICVGFLFLGMSYGFLIRSQGFSFVYPMLMSLFIFAGSMEFVTANLLLMPTFQPLHAFLLPGGTAAAAQAHVCRTVCRRAEAGAVPVLGPSAIRGRPADKKLPQPVVDGGLLYDG